MYTTLYKYRLNEYLLFLNTWNSKLFIFIEFLTWPSSVQKIGSKIAYKCPTICKGMIIILCIP